MPIGIAVSAGADDRVAVLGTNVWRIADIRSTDGRSMIKGFDVYTVLVEE